MLRAFLQNCKAPRMWNKMHLFHLASCVWCVFVVIFFSLFRWHTKPVSQRNCAWWSRSWAVWTRSRPCSPTTMKPSTSPLSTSSTDSSQRRLASLRTACSEETMTNVICSVDNTHRVCHLDIWHSYNPHQGCVWMWLWLSVMWQFVSLDINHFLKCFKLKTIREEFRVWMDC